MHKIVISALLMFVFFASCEEKPEPLGSCEDGQWAKANRNGEAHCMGAVEVTYWNANTNSAKIILFTRDESLTTLTPEINAEFSVPIEGVTLNTAYPLIEGKILDADVITEGSLTLLVFDPPGTQNSGCIAGTFSLKAESGGVTTFEYTEGTFVFAKGQGADNYYAPSSCNPF
ncbi:hypothetical protein QWY31_03490 [Cytophagales bacterium LB-30]|uniref:Lipoprotein n=1 Tax=Shiella aurantiaca TaxID=3058365 RepID=A0ABT8F271_9BACT|nr:hypothetical protein [Shiella aurantiaca]MDN4164548.1 hypothetical protein [Shiella aurantiaca]